MLFDLDALRSSSPPFSIVLAALAFGIVLGLTFERCLRSRVDEWRQGVETLDRATLNNQILLLAMPFWGATVAVAICFGGCIQLFGFQPPAAYSVSFVVSVLGGGAVWWQLQSMIERFAAKRFA